MGDGRRETRVLVVDDHADTRALAELALRDAGYEVRQAIDGADALDTVRAWNPHVVITDIFMDTMDGVELIRALRRGAYRVKVIAISAGWGARTPGARAAAPGGIDVLQDAVTAGADATMLKPLDTRGLVRTVGRLLGEAA